MAKIAMLFVLGATLLCWGVLAAPADKEEPEVPKAVAAEDPHEEPADLSGSTGEKDLETANSYWGWGGPYYYRSYYYRPYYYGYGYPGWGWGRRRWWY